MKKEFNYCVGRKDDDGRIAAYAYGKEIFFGTMKDAQHYLEFVVRRSDKTGYRIFKVVEIE